MVTAVFDQSGNCRVIYGDSPEVKISGSGIMASASGFRD